MYLVYLDESGNTGRNLTDPSQPIFCLCAMIVAEDKWQSLEIALKAVLDDRIPTWRTTPDFEIHGQELRNGSGLFRGISVVDRIQFRDEWMQAGVDHGIKLIARCVQKKRYAEWMVKTLGSGVSLNPHIAAFALISRCIDNYLAGLPGPPLGILISDENKEIVLDVEKAIHTLRALEGTMKLGRIVEKGFFIDSRKSLILQLCDLFTLALRKKEELAWGGNPKSVDQSGIVIAQELLVRNYQHDKDVLEWLTNQFSAGAKKGAARG